MVGRSEWGRVRPTSTCLVVISCGLGWTQMGIFLQDAGSSHPSKTGGSVRPTSTALSSVPRRSGRGRPDAGSSCWWLLAWRTTGRRSGARQRGSSARPGEHGLARWSGGATAKVCAGRGKGDYGWPSFIKLDAGGAGANGDRWRSQGKMWPAVWQG
jgi:hypothetical protein